MNRIFILPGILAVSLLAAPVFATAADDSPDNPPMPGAHGEQHRINPVEKTQKHLDQLEQKLHLKAGQQTAWKTYSSTALARANERAAHMKKHHARRGEHHADMDTAARLEHMSQRMRKHAEKLQQMAQDTRSFQQALSPEQQTIFDLYWKSQFHHGKNRHRS